MAYSTEQKFGNIYMLLSEHNFLLNMKDKFKCSRCEGILIDACVSPCGCKYCRKCVDEIIMSGVEKCPGNTEECKSEDLSNIAPDHRMNRKISKLLVKCPEQMCAHECQLIEMEEHIRLCSKKPVQCPCHDIGCHDDDLLVDRINEHLQTDSYNHWKMLIRMIGDLRNEVRAKDDRIEAMRTEMMNEIIKWQVEINGKIESIKMQAKDDRMEAMRTEMMNEITKCQVETEMLRGQMQAKDQIIDVMTDDIKLMKDEMEMLRRQIDIGKDNLDSKIDVMAAQINGDIESIKMERTELSGELGNLNGKLEGIRVELDARLDETRRGCMGHVEEQLGLINGAMVKYQDQMADRMDEMKTLIDGKIDGTRFVWSIDKISSIGFSPEESRSSEYFSPNINPYKMQLRMDNNKSDLRIWLRIHPTMNDANLKWPFQAKVTVKVTNQATPAACMAATKYWNILRPQNILFSHNWDDSCIFSIANLSYKNLLLGDCCIVECLVDLQ